MNFRELELTFKVIDLEYEKMCLEYYIEELETEIRDMINNMEPTKENFLNMLRGSIMSKEDIDDILEELFIRRRAAANSVEFNPLGHMPTLSFQDLSSWCAGSTQDFIKFKDLYMKGVIKDD